jgi:hypothetical protein
MIKYFRKKIRLIFETFSDLKEAVDADEILWSIFSRNNIEKATIEVKFEGEIFTTSKEDINIFPTSKTAILYEPVVVNNVMRMETGRIFKKASYYYPSADVQSLIDIISTDFVWEGLSCKSRNRLLALRSAFVVTFHTKNKSISVDRVEVD